MENFSRGADRGDSRGGDRGNDRGGRDGSKGSFRNGGFRGGSKGGFKGGWKGGDRGSFGGDDRPKTMHPATCSGCSKACEVPFRPTGEKPVYCRDCFAGRAALGGERSNRRDDRSSNPKPSFVPQLSSNNDDIRKQIDSMNVKLDKLTNTIQNLAEKLNKAEAIAIVPATSSSTVKSPTVIEEKMIAKPKEKVAKKTKVSKK